MPGCWVINPSGAWQAGSVPGHCLIDRFLLAPARGGCSRPGRALVGGDKCDTAACARSHQAWHCQLAALLGWWAGKTQAPGCCCGENMGGGLAPHILQWVVPKFVPKSPPQQVQGAGAGFAPCHGRWVPRGGHHVARGVYLQTGGSWHRAAGHQRDPAAYNVNYHHVIKSP